MNEFRSKQTNPYSTRPDQPKPRVAEEKSVPEAPVKAEPELPFNPMPDEPELGLVGTPVSQQAFDQPVLVNQPLKQAKKPVPKLLIITPVAILILSALAGGGYWLHKKQMASLENKLLAAKEESSNLKAGKFGSTDGQGLSLLGSTDEQAPAAESGEVAGTTDESETVDGYVYAGHTAIRDDQLLIEVYVDNRQTGKIIAIWANYGGGESSLYKKTNKTTKNLSNADGIVQMVAETPLSDFEPGSSYMYQISAQNDEGKIYKSGISVFTIPKDEKKPQSSTGSGL